MSRIVNVDVGEKEKLCNICKALSVPDRIDILKLIESKGLSISEISEQLGIPQSSVTFHMKALEKADMISIEERPGMHGTMKLCTRKTDYINISAYEKNSDINHYQSCEMPIGAYYDLMYILPADWQMRMESLVLRTGWILFSSGANRSRHFVDFKGVGILSVS